MNKTSQEKTEVYSVTFFLKGKKNKSNSYRNLNSKWIKPSVNL